VGNATMGDSTRHLSGAAVFHHRCTIHRLWKKGDVLDRRISFEQQGQKRWTSGEDLARPHGDLSRGKKREHGT
jgi:hypothetical protein